MTRTRRLAAGLLAAGTAVAVSGCGTSLDAQTYQERNNAESTNDAVGTLAIRNVAVEPPRVGDVYEVGDDAPVIITVVNAGPEEDRLLEARSPVAQEVEVVSEEGAGRAELGVPALGSSDESVALVLRGLTEEVRTGEYVELTLRFAENGETTFLVPVALTGESDRPVYTGEYEEGGEEPALQAPAGGHGEEEAGEGEEEGREAPSTQEQGEIGAEGQSTEVEPG